MINKLSVAAFIAQYIHLSGKSQVDIAIEAGFEKPNIITMLKQGRTKLPLAKIGTMANALETDPTYLLKLCLEEYYPETWNAISPYMDEMLTADEFALLQHLRSCANSPYLASCTADQKRKLQDFLNSMSQVTIAMH